MDNSIDIDLTQAARELDLPEPSVRQTVALLDDGNTVPFVTRFRRAQTGALNEDQIRQIQDLVTRMRALAERKRTILKSIQVQGLLTPAVTDQIRKSRTIKRLEDLYLPFRPKKRTLATVARRCGLEPLAHRVLQGGLDQQQLQSEAEQAVAAGPDLETVAQAITGVGHIVAEWFSERAEVRGRLRQLIMRSGFLCCRAAKSPGESTTPPTTTPDAAAENDAPDAVPASDAPAPVGGGPDAPADVPTSRPAEGPVHRKGRHGPLAASLERREKKRRKLEAAFKDYAEFREKLTRLPPHRVLAINRGERARILRARIEFNRDAVFAKAKKWLIPEGHPNVDLLERCVRDSLDRLILPSLEREIRRELTEQAAVHAVDVFAKNLRTLLLQPPVRGPNVLAIDPGFRSGCKVVAIDACGNPLEHTTIYLVGNKPRVQQGRRKIVDLLKRHQIAVVAVGNGTACRETEQLISAVINDDVREADIAFVIVNEAGASVYSTSPLGREELPDFDPTVRSAISIGRRLLDPLSELVKINPANIGVGMYQHDLKAKHLQATLDAVVESCVNYVGVDVNTASPALLGYVSGLNQLTARRMCEYRAQHGPFRTREQFKEVPGFGAATFVQAAGFLKIVDGENPLDATWIHPESYPIAGRLLAELRRLRGAPDGTQESTARADAAAAVPATESVDALDHDSAAAPSLQTLAADVKAFEWIDRVVENVDLEQLGAQWDVNRLLLEDILESLRRPGRDPREDFPSPVLRRNVLKLDDLKQGMELAGTVLNVVDFGVFVDIGLPDSGLVHISRLVDQFVRDPHEVYGVGDPIRVWVMDVDKRRRRVSLTAIDPAAPRAKQKRERQPARAGQTQQRRHDRSARKPVSKDRRAAQGRTPTRRSKRPQTVTPITKQMEEGKEPLRSFSDLMQFYQKKKQE